MIVKNITVTSLVPRPLGEGPGDKAVIGPVPRPSGREGPGDKAVTSPISSLLLPWLDPWVFCSLCWSLSTELHTASARSPELGGSTCDNMSEREREREREREIPI